MAVKNFLLVNNYLTLSSFIVVKNLDSIAKFSSINTRRKYMYLFIAYFLGETLKFCVGTSDEVSNNHWFTGIQ